MKGFGFMLVTIVGGPLFVGGFWLLLGAFFDTSEFTIGAYVVLIVAPLLLLAIGLGIWTRSSGVEIAFAFIIALLITFVAGVFILAIGLDHAGVVGNTEPT